MAKSKNFVFVFLHIISWIIFVGGLIVNFFFSLYRPEFVQNLYQKLDLGEMYNLSKSAFYGMYSFILVISILKAYLFYVVIMLISQLNLSKPFNSYAANQIKNISYYTLSIGLISHLARETSKYLQKRGFEIDILNQFWADSQAFILMAAVLYVIATIFSRGVEIQNENDLTV